MTLQEILKSNPEAKAEYDDNLRSAEATGREKAAIEGMAEIVNAERARIASILDKSDTVISEIVADAIDRGFTAEQYASAEIDRQKAMRKNSTGVTFKTLAAKQTPGEQDTEQTAKILSDEEIESRAKALADKINKAVEGAY